MSRNERWNTPNEIRRSFPETASPGCGAGPVIYYENGKKYCDDSEAHIAVIGRTGKGKSQCCSLPYMREIIRKGESYIMLDPKGEGYRLNACFIPDSYQKFCIDFRNPRKSPTRWNPLTVPYRLYKSDDPDDHDIASSMISELWNGVYPQDDHADRFWPESAANYAKGLTYAMFEAAPAEEVNLDSVAVMMEQSESRLGGSTILKEFHDTLPLESLARRNLATYANAPNETRGSIHSVAASGLEVFSRSKGLMEMLGEDTLNILDIDVDRPFAITIITPDETSVYDSLSGLLVSQLSQHLIRVAQSRGGKLPIRVHIILEELGSVGKSIPTLPNLMVAGRSRNIRLMLVLQSISQLADVYGKSEAETINSCIGITIGFSTNSWETLGEWSQRCGDRQIESGNHIMKEPLITASQLAAMPTGTALVLIENQYKFIARLPFFNEMYDNSGWREPSPDRGIRRSRMKTFNLEQMVKDIKQQKIESMMRELTATSPQAQSGNNSSNSSPANLSVNDLVSRIDAKLAELNQEEKKKKQKKAEYKVLIEDSQANRRKIIKAIADSTGMSFTEALNRLDAFPCIIVFDNKRKAEALRKEIISAGGKARILPED